MTEHTTHKKSDDRRMTIFPKFGIFHWMRDHQLLYGREVSQQWERGGYALHYLVRTFGEAEAARIIREEEQQVEQVQPQVQRGRKGPRGPKGRYESDPEREQLCV